MAFTITWTGVDDKDVQPLAETDTANTPVVVTLIVEVVEPSVQRLPLGLLDNSVTLPPSQKVVGPLAVMEGVAGTGVTVTITGLETLEVQPEATWKTV